MEKERIKEFAGKVMSDLSGGMAAGLAYVGAQTGLFQTLSGQGPMTIEHIVEKSGLQPRYVEEWLKGMVCAEYLQYDVDNETFELPDELGFLLASEGTDHYMGGLLHSLPMMLSMAPRVSDAFISGGGVPFEDYGQDGILAIDLMNRGLYEQRFVSYWLKSMPTVYEKLTAGGRVLDFGCGTGHATLTMADAFPKSQFIGLDIDPASIEQACKNAQDAGLTDNLKFVQGTFLDLEPGQQFDLITTCDCIHDLTDPVGVLKKLCELLSADGTVFIIEPKVADSLTENINPIGALYYGMSVFHCMTQSLAAGGPGLGTCLGPSGMESLVKQAGFNSFEVLELKSQMTIFYAVRH